MSSEQKITRIIAVALKIAEAPDDLQRPKLDEWILKNIPDYTIREFEIALNILDYLEEVADG